MTGLRPKASASGPHAFETSAIMRTTTESVSAAVGAGTPNSRERSGRIGCVM